MKTPPSSKKPRAKTARAAASSKSAKTKTRVSRFKSRMAAADFNRLWKPWAATAGAAAFLATAVWGGQAIRTHLKLTEAEAQIKRGFTALAAETLDPFRIELTSSLRGCTNLVAAYFGAHRPDRLEWASQACITAGIETPDTYIALAAARELTGQDGEALKILDQVAKKFDKSPDPLYRMAQIFRRSKKDAEVADLLSRAMELAPSNSQLSMETLEALSAVQRWTEARRVADRIKTVESDSPEVKLVIARALLKGGDTQGAQALATQARGLMDKKPEFKEALEHAFEDVFSGKVGNTQTPGKIASTPGAADPGRGLASPNLGNPGSTRAPGTADAGRGLAPPSTGAALAPNPVQMAAPPLSPATPPRVF